MLSESTGVECVQLQVWVGLDLAKKTFVAAMAFAPTSVPVRSFPTTREGIEQLLNWCDEQILTRRPGAQLRFVMEATGNISKNVFKWLHQIRSETAPAIVNPHYIKSFGDSLGARNKTDSADAKVIARYGHERTPAGETPATPQREELLALSRERETIIEQRTAEKNRLSEPCAQSRIIKMREQRIKLMSAQIREIDKLIRQIIDQTPDLKRDYCLLDSIPGVGFVVAVTILAELGDLRRFATPRKLTGFCGVSPRQFTSGTTIHKQTRMCKKGNKHVRPMLHLAARSLIGRNKYAMGRLYDELVSRGKTKCAAIGILSRKLLVLMRAVLVNGTPYQEQDIPCGKPTSETGENFHCAVCPA